MLTCQEGRTTPEDIGRWTLALIQLHSRIASHFARPEPRHHAFLYLRGLLSNAPRKNGWQLAEQAGEAKPYGLQRLLGRSEEPSNELGAKI